MTTQTVVRPVVVRRGISGLSVLGIIFVLCKIFAIGPVALWSWWLVLLPFYVSILIPLAFISIPVVLALLGATLFGIVLLGAKAMDTFTDWKNRRHRAKR